MAVLSFSLKSLRKYSSSINPMLCRYFSRLQCPIISFHILLKLYYLIFDPHSPLLWEFSLVFYWIYGSQIVAIVLIIVVIHFRTPALVKFSGITNIVLRAIWVFCFLFCKNVGCFVSFFFSVFWYPGKIAVNREFNIKIFN